MMEEEKTYVSDFSQQMQDYINDLFSRGLKVFSKTEKSSNVTLSIGDLNCPIRVDDSELLYIGTALLPNIVNYLVNILPQFIYPYIVAYLQDLSTMRDDPVTVHELYSFLNSDYANGNILDSTQDEG